MVHWYIDFEAFQFNNTFYIKEICILKHDRTICLNYYVKNPQDIPYLPFSKTIQYQMQRHQLSWNFGHLTFDNTIQQIRAHVGGCIVYIKGHEKFCFLKEHIPNLYKIDAFPSFKSMNNCASDVCDVRHGTNCARRKVHELRFIDIYKA